MEQAFDRKNEITMKLLHYFITEKDYNPIILQGADDEIWLENMTGEYRIIRIVSNHIHNNEQLSFDVFKTKRVVKKIKKKTISLNMNVLTIFTDLDDNVDIDRVKDMDCVYLYDIFDIDKYDVFKNKFPDILNKLKFNEEGMQLFLKITADINNKNRRDAEMVNEVFEEKKPIVTNTLIFINVLVFLLTLANHTQAVYTFATNPLLVSQNHEFYRLFTAMFLHGDIWHILFNIYALHIIGNQVESYMGRWKYLGIYLFSGITGSLLSCALSGVDIFSIGASGAIFGLLGCLLYFGYHYRVYLGGVLKSQIIPLIVLNLMIGFMSSGIDNFAHIGGLIGGVTSTMALGVKYKSDKSERINGCVISLIILGFFFMMVMNRNF